jgi:biotin carboxylase
LKTILILGGGGMQIPAIRIAKEKDWRVIVADGNPDALGRELADGFEHVDLKDLDGMLKAARRRYEHEGLDGVFTAGTDFSATVAWVAEKLGLPGIGYETALNATDKTRMRRKFSEAMVPSPRYIRLESNHTIEKVFETLDFPMVMKPVDNMGARGIRRIDTAHELTAWLPEAFRHSRSGAVIVEEFVPGSEYSIDAVVENGKVTICGFADRHITFDPYFVEMGHTIPSEAPAERIEEMTAVFNSGVKALGITIGAAKGDVKYSPRGPVIGEIAARLSGGYMSGWTYPYSSGVEVTAAALNLAVGLPAGDLKPRWQGISAERAYISIPGKIEEISGVRAAEQMVGIKNVLPRVKVGDGVRFPTNNVQKCGNIISQSLDRLSAVRSAEQAVGRIQLRLRPGEKETSSFLFGKSDSWVPPAFSVRDPENVSVLGRMLGYLVETSDVETNRKPGADSTEIVVIELPRIENEAGRDWHGTTLVDAFENVRRSTGIICFPWDGVNSADAVPTVHRTSGRITLGKVFWHGMVRGGYQGGVWIIDTIFSLRRRKTLNEIEDTLREWCEEAFS